MSAVSIVEQAESCNKSVAISAQRSPQAQQTKLKMNPSESQVPVIEMSQTYSEELHSILSDLGQIMDLNSPGQSSDHDALLGDRILWLKDERSQDHESPLRVGGRQRTYSFLCDSPRLSCSHPVGPNTQIPRRSTAFYQNFDLVKPCEESDPSEFDLHLDTISVLKKRQKPVDDEFTTQPIEKAEPEVKAELPKQVKIPQRLPPKIQPKIEYKVSSLKEEEDVSYEKEKRGLKLLTQEVYKTMREFKSLTYKEVAANIIIRLGEAHLLMERNNKEAQNIKRRVYDALNVLVACGVYQRKGKLVQVILPLKPIKPLKNVYDQAKINTDSMKLQTNLETVCCKIKFIQERVEALQSLELLQQRNKKLPQETKKLFFPLMLVTVSKGVQESTEYSADKKKAAFKNVSNIRSELKLCKMLKIDEKLEKSVFDDLQFLPKMKELGDDQNKVED